MWIGMTPNPDPTFVRKLKSYDPTLGIYFDREHECFVITQKSRIGGDVPLFKVLNQHPDEIPYRQPDERDIRLIWEFDMRRKAYDQWKETVQKGEDYMINYQYDQEKKAEEEIRDIGRDNKYQIARTWAEAANSGKGLRHTRPVKVKPKGKVF